MMFQEKKTLSEDSTMVGDFKTTGTPPEAPETVRLITSLHETAEVLSWHLVLSRWFFHLFQWVK
jgi:hypothetical protein